MWFCIALFVYVYLIIFDHGWINKQINKQTNKQTNKQILLISTAFSMFNLYRTTRFSDIITLQRPSVCSRLKVTDRSFTMLLYFGILYSNHCGNFRLLHHSALLLILLLHLSCPGISFTLNSKLFSLNYPFLLSLLHQLLSVFWPLDLANGFHLTVICTLSCIFSISE